MAYSEILAERVRDALADLPRVTEKKMFGGIAFTVEQKMCVTVGADRIMLRVDPAIEAAQHQKLADSRARRDNAKVNEFRAQLEGAAREKANLMPLFITCVENDVTLGEICHTLRGIFGEYRPNVSI